MEWNEVYDKIRRTGAAARAREMRMQQREAAQVTPPENGAPPGVDPRDMIAAHFAGK